MAYRAAMRELYDDRPEPVRLRAAFRIVLDDARALGRENGLADVDPAGVCLYRDDDHGPSTLPGETVMVAYRAAWRVAAKARQGHAHE